MVSTKEKAVAYKWEPYLKLLVVENARGQRQGEF
jgi:hypothetical protein